MEMAYARRILTINGVERSFICDNEQDSLADALRNLGLTGTKIGCGKGQCGACNVIMDGKLIRSCTRKMRMVKDGSNVLTIESLGTAENLHPLQLAWIVYGGVQCGFCSPGFIVSAKALLDENDHPTRDEVRAWFQKNRNACRCTGYKPLVDAVMAAAEVIRGEKTMEDLFRMVPQDEVFHTRYPKPTALGKVLGQTDYGADIEIKVPGMLHCAAHFSTAGHANIISIDTSEAEKAEGVVRVLTAKDVPGPNRTLFPVGSTWSDAFGDDRPVLCDEKVFRIGDPIAFVVADTRNHARAAAALVKVEYEELPVYPDVLSAVQEGTVQIHPGIPNEFLRKARYHGEDTRLTMPRSAHIAEFSVRNQVQSHLPIEPDTANAYIDMDGKLVIMFKTHSLHQTFGMIAPPLALEPDDIRLILNPSGGAFGYSFTPGTAVLVGLAALVTKKPVSWTMSYEEHQMFTGRRPAAYQNCRIGCDEDGKITSAELYMLSDNGCYSEAAGGGAMIPTKYFMTPYTTPSARVLATVGFSNSNYNIAYRCPTAAQMFTGQEQVMDMLAEELGMDPLDFRLKNVWQPGDVAIYGEQPTVYVAEKVMAAIRPKYEELKAHAAAQNAAQTAAGGAKRYGVGLAFGSFNISNSGDSAEIAIELNPDGTVTHYSTWHDLGQGADVGCLAYVHEAMKPLGLKPDQIHLVMNDTATCPNSGRAAASRSNLMLGLATQDGAAKLLNAMRKKDGTYRTYAEMQAEGIPTRYAGIHKIPVNEKLNENNGFGKFPPDQSYAIFCAEVEVDEAAGKVCVLDYHCICDCGLTTNWLSLEGQGFGGMMHSLGYALSENYENPKKHGNLIGAGFPFIEAVPDGDHFTVQNLETPRPYSPFGGSGVSEAFQSSGHVAILNAIYKASKIRVQYLPATPDKVKAELAKRDSGDPVEYETFDFGREFYEYLDYIAEHPRAKYEGWEVVH